MSFNLLDLAKGAITDKVMGSIGGILGTDKKATGTAIDAALPALIGGIMKKSSSSGGAGEIFGVLDNHDGGILENLGGIFDGGEKQGGMLDMGQGILKMIFGGGLTKILGTIAKLLGMESGVVGKLLGVLAPILMGVMGKQKKTAGWDIGNFTSAMSEQANHMPRMDSSLMDSLGVSSLLGSAKGVASGAAGAVSDVAGAAGKAVSGGVDKAADAAAGGANLIKLLLPLILLAALAFLIWKFVLSGGGEGNDAEKNKDKSGEVSNEPPSTPSLGTGGGLGGMAQALPGQFTKVFDNAKGAISGVTDVASAETAAEKLDGFSTKFGSLGGALGGAPDAIKTKITESISGFTGDIPGLAEKAYSHEGVKAVLEPSVKNMLDKLSGFGK